MVVEENIVKYFWIAKIANIFCNVCIISGYKGKDRNGHQLYKE